MKRQYKHNAQKQLFAPTKLRMDGWMVKHFRTIERCGHGRLEQQHHDQNAIVRIHQTDRQGNLGLFLGGVDQMNGDMDEG